MHSRRQYGQHVLVGLRAWSSWMDRLLRDGKMSLLQAAEYLPERPDRLHLMVDSHVGLATVEVVLAQQHERLRRVLHRAQSVDKHILHQRKVRRRTPPRAAPVRRLGEVLQRHVRGQPRAGLHEVRPIAADELADRDHEGLVVLIGVAAREVAACARRQIDARHAEAVRMRRQTSRGGIPKLRLARPLVQIRLQDARGRGQEAENRPSGRKQVPIRNRDRTLERGPTEHGRPYEVVALVRIHELHSKKTQRHDPQVTLALQRLRGKLQQHLDIAHVAVSAVGAQAGQESVQGPLHPRPAVSISVHRGGLATQVRYICNLHPLLTVRAYPEIVLSKSLRGTCMKTRLLQ
mmetsp:Transcript_96074/g.275919  ORF Transcript_96074/g.275919 Transcript_96074/m.275919 type:complete len:348 (+) Transcript_96074:1187-2230(+)